MYLSRVGRYRAISFGAVLAEEVFEGGLAAWSCLLSMLILRFTNGVGYVQGS